MVLEMLCHFTFLYKPYLSNLLHYRNKSLTTQTLNNFAKQQNSSDKAKICFIEFLKVYGASFKYIFVCCRFNSKINLFM